MDYRKLNLQTIRDAYAVPKMSLFQLLLGHNGFLWWTSHRGVTKLRCPVSGTAGNHTYDCICNPRFISKWVLSWEPDSKNWKDILVITDHFTKYAVAIPTRDQKASTVVRCLWERSLVRYWFPEWLHSDQGWDFKLHTIQEPCSLLGVRKVRTSLYDPRGNPGERYLPPSMTDNT